MVIDLHKLKLTHTVLCIPLRRKKSIACEQLVSNCLVGQLSYVTANQEGSISGSGQGLLLGFSYKKFLQSKVWKFGGVSSPCFRRQRKSVHTQFPIINEQNSPTENFIIDEPEHGCGVSLC